VLVRGIKKKRLLVPLVLEVALLVGCGGDDVAPPIDAASVDTPVDTPTDTPIDVPPPMD